MKIDRLIGILSVLLRQELVTAPQLAEKFEVSRRTINRDVESLCMAGIPIATSQGANGGISIAHGYKLDKTFLTRTELGEILAGLKSPEKSDFRMFKLNRMQELRLGTETFEREDVPLPTFEAAGIFPPRTTVSVLVRPEFKWRIVDEYGPDSFTVREDKNLLFRFGFSDKEYLFAWVLGFGGGAELLEPPELRAELALRLQKMNEQYRGT